MFGSFLDVSTLNQKVYLYMVIKFNIFSTSIWKNSDFSFFCFFPFRIPIFFGRLVSFAILMNFILFFPLEFSMIFQKTHKFADCSHIFSNSHNNFEIIWLFKISMTCDFYKKTKKKKNIYYKMLYWK